MSRLMRGSWTLNSPGALFGLELGLRVRVGKGFPTCAEIVGHRTITRIATAEMSCMRAFIAQEVRIRNQQHQVQAISCYI